MNGEDIREPEPDSALVQSGRHFSFTFADCDKHAFPRLISHLAQSAALYLNFHFGWRAVRTRTKPRRVDAIA
jgi:hypothetical protein